MGTKHSQLGNKLKCRSACNYESKADLLNNDLYNDISRHPKRFVKLLPSSLDEPQALCSKASRDGRSHFNTSLSPPFFRKQSPAAGGLTGGQWEVLGKHLPSHFPFIYRPFTPLTGGREVFYKNVFLTTSIYHSRHFLPLSSNQSANASSKVHLNSYPLYLIYLPEILVEICSFFTRAGQIPIGLPTSFAHAAIGIMTALGI